MVGGGKRRNLGYNPKPAQHQCRALALTLCALKYAIKHVHSIFSVGSADVVPMPVSYPGSQEDASLLEVSAVVRSWGHPGRAEGDRFGVRISGAELHCILHSVLGQNARHGVFQVYDSKTARTDLRSPIAELGLFPGARG